MYGCTHKLSVDNWDVVRRTGAKVFLAALNDECETMSVDVLNSLAQSAAEQGGRGLKLFYLLGAGAEYNPGTAVFNYLRPLADLDDRQQAHSHLLIRYLKHGNANGVFQMDIPFISAAVLLGEIGLVQALIDDNAVCTGADGNPIVPEGHDDLVDLAMSRGYDDITQMLTEHDAQNCGDYCNASHLQYYAEHDDGPGCHLPGNQPACEAGQNVWWTTNEECINPKDLAHIDNAIVDSGDLEFVQDLIAADVQCIVRPASEGPKLAEYAASVGQEGIGAALTQHDFEVCGDYCRASHRSYDAAAGVCILPTDISGCFAGPFAWWNDEHRCIDPVESCSLQ